MGFDLWLVIMGLGIVIIVFSIKLLKLEEKKRMKNPYIDSRFERDNDNENQV